MSISSSIANGSGNYTCERHGVACTPLSPCPKCPTDPGPAPGDEIDAPLSPAPRGCLSSLAVERELLTDARKLKTLITSAAEWAENDYHWANSLAKLYDTRVKILRAAATCARDREHEEIVRRREKRERDALGGKAN